MTNNRKLFFILISLVIIIEGNGERTKDKMYENIKGTAACFRKLNSTHKTGCSSDRPGSTGVIHLVNNDSDLQFLIENSTAGPYIAVMPVTLLSARTLNIIKQHPDKVSGVVAHRDVSLPPSYSNEARCPNEGYGLKDMCDAEGWNPWGTGVLQGDYPFPIFLLSDLENLDKIRQCFHKFNDHDYENQAHRSLCSLELSAFMFAAVNSQTCLRRGMLWVTVTNVRYCDPLGDYNIWSTLFPWELTPNRVKDVILLTARMDTTSLFYELHPGAESAVSGLVTLMVTAELLKRMVANEEKYERNVFFVIFNGESYDYIGSQRFVYDVLNKKFPMERDENIKRNVPHLTMEDIKLIVELGQITNRSSLFMHYLDSQATQIKEIKDYIKKYSQNVKIVEASEHKRLPPASVQSFLQENENISSIIITDHDQKFTNPYYNSLYDDSRNLQYEYINVTEDDGNDKVFAGTVQRRIADVADMIARAVYKEAMGKEYDGNEKANVFYVNELLNCYLDTANCKLYKSVILKEYISEKPLSLYVGVVESSNAQTTLTARTLAWLTGTPTNLSESKCVGDPHDPVYQYMWMSADLENLNATTCFKTTVNYSLAISPAFEITDYEWSSGKYSTWTESVWKDLSMRMYLKPSARHELVTISIGTVTLVLSVALVYFVNSRSDILFPKPAGIATGQGTSC